MKLTVVSCGCGNPKQHVKLQDEHGGKTKGIFCLAAGRYIIGTLLAGGHMTEAEYTATDTELVASGLPELETSTDAQLEKEAIEVISAFDSAAEADAAIDQKVTEGQLSPASAERLHEIILEIAHDPTRVLTIMLADVF
jgi:hypothetical protein